MGRKWYVSCLVFRSPAAEFPIRYLDNGVQLVSHLYPYIFQNCLKSLPCRDDFWPFFMMREYSSSGASSEHLP